MQLEKPLLVNTVTQWSKENNYKISQFLT